MNRHPEFDDHLKPYRHNQKLTPYDIFDFAFPRFYYQINFSSFDSLDISILNILETKIYSKKYSGNDRKKFNTYKHDIINNLLETLTVKNITSCKNRFSMFINNVESQLGDFFYKLRYSEINLKRFNEMYQKELERIYRQKPIKTSEFPCFTPITEKSSQEEKENQKDQELLLSILNRSTKNYDNDNTQEKQPQLTFSQTDLLEFYDILCKKRKFFAFSPSFVFDAIEILDNFLNSLQKTSTKESNGDQTLINYFHNLDSKSDEFKCYHLILLIKMRLFANINQIYNFLAALFELIIIEQDKTELNIDDKFSYKKILSEILPSCKDRRSKIFKNVSPDQILDFCFSHNEQNDFVLTKDGVFKISNQKDNQIEFEPSNLIKIDFDVSEYDEKVTKIAFSNGILYLFDGKTKTIHKAVISEDEEFSKKAAEVQKKLENAKNHSDKDHTKPKAQTKAKKNENSTKKLREKEKKEKRQKRKAEKLEVEKSEFNNETAKVNLPDFPVLSVGCYDNYFQIVQRKSCNEDKTILVLTIIDLSANNRIEYNIEEAFQPAKENIKQVQKEVVIENKQTKMKDAFFSEDYLMISFEDSSIQQWMIYRDGRADLFRSNISPLANISNSTVRMDNKSVLYNLVPIENEGEKAISITKMYIPETDYCINNENSLFLKHPYLQNLSSIVDNCWQLIINYKFKVELAVIDILEDEELKSVKQPDNIKVIDKSDLSDFKLQVSPNEMSFFNQSLISSTSQLEKIKLLIKDIKDESIKKFFIIVLIRIIGIEFYYDLNRNFSSVSIDDIAIKAFKSFKTLILDLYSMSSSLSSDDSFDLMLKESMMITLFIGGKYLFIPDSYDELHGIMKQILTGKFAQPILRCLSNFMFSLPSSLYLIDQTVYEHLMKIKNEIDINDLFIKNSTLIQSEACYTTKSKDEIIENMSPYFQTLFNHFRDALSDESIPVIYAEQLFANIVSIDTENINFLLILEKELVGISKSYYERIRKIPEVIESESKFNDFSCDYKAQEFKTEVKVIESQHPYNLNPLPLYEPPKNEEKKTKKDKKKSKDHKKPKKYAYIDLGTVDFGVNANKMYIQFDPRSQLYESDLVVIYLPAEMKKLIRKFDDTIDIESNKARIIIRRSIIKQPKENKPFWGVKMIINGVYSNDCKWNPCKHLYIFNSFIYFLADFHNKSFQSTPVTDPENDFKFIMDEKFIQGINLNDIQNYEESLKSGKNDKSNKDSKKVTRQISRGISRGISYDSETKSHFDDKIKKDFINGIITVTKDSPSNKYKRFLDFIYMKTSRRNFLRTNESILEIERYFAACLLKQLGLITLCLDLNKVLITTPENELKNIDVPNRLLDLWKKNIYPLRNKLLFAFQRSNSNNNNNNSDDNSQSFVYNFKEYSEEIKNKCILLLYSDPILKFKDKGSLSNEVFESAMKSIFSFVTSKSPLKDITKIIEVQRERLNYSSQSLSLILPFVEQSPLFNSSKSVFALQYDCSSIRKLCQGLSQRELDEYENLMSLLSVKFIQNIFLNPSVPITLNMDYLYNLICSHKEIESKIKCSKLIIDQLEMNKNNKSSFRDRINFSLVLILALITIKSKSNDLANYIVSFLSKEDLDSDSKTLILIVIPLIIQVFHDNSNLLDESLVFSLLENNKFNPCIIKYMFYWISSLFDNKDMTNHRDFIVKVFKGIGQSYIGKSCLFIDDSFQPLSHRQVSESMISFIRLLFNSENKLLFSVIHDILTNNLKGINEQKVEEMLISIGLFASLGSSISSIEPERYLVDCIYLNSFLGIKGYGRSNDEIKMEINNSIFEPPIYTNVVLLKYIEFCLNDQEIHNILQVHESILHSKYFNGQGNNADIDDKEIAENIFISTFYSFLSIVMQNTNNMSIMLNEKNIKRTLSISEISNQTIPSSTSSTIILSHNLEQAITSPLYNESSPNDFLNDSLRFMKMNYGEVIYGKENNDIIKTNKRFTSVFVCDRIFDHEKETYFNVKVDNIDSHSIFVGFIDTSEFDFNKSFGFGTTLHNEYFYRKTPILIDNDMISIKNVKSIGCYYTKKYVYLLINGCLTPYRVSHPSLISYVPIIYVNRDELEIEVLQNVTVVDHSNEKFSFLSIDQFSEDSYEEKDIKEISNQDEEINDLYESRNNYGFLNKNLMIGQEYYHNIVKPFPYSSEAKDPSCALSRLLYYKHQPGVIKDISIIEDNEFIVNVKGSVYNRNTLSNQEFDLISKYISFNPTNYFNLIENRINTRFGMNSSLSVKHLQDKPNDLNSIRQYVKSKTINDNSKSIAIIMSRYLIFIMVDYLRFSKSNLLQEEGINSNESQIIINALAHSLRNIITFSPSFKLNLSELYSDLVADDYLIFQEEQEKQIEDNENQIIDVKPFFKIAGNYQFFNISFLAFMKKSEQLISPQFLLKLIQASYEIVTKDSSITHSYLYDLIPSKHKLESISPLTEKLSIKKKIYFSNNTSDIDRSSNREKVNSYIGTVPILLSSIPDQFPSALFFQKRMRISSDKISYYAKFDGSYADITMEWKYDTNSLKSKYSEFSYEPKDYKNYEFKLGLYAIPSQLPEFITKSSFGFIHNLLVIFRSINYSEFLYKKHKKYLGALILEKIFSLTLTKNPLVYPFVESIILAFSSSGKFSDNLLTKEAIESFSILTSFSKTLYPINQFPSADNETPIIFSIYSSLVNEYKLEKSIESQQSNNNNDDDDENGILNLFNNFVNMDDDLFNAFSMDKVNDSDFSEGTLVTQLNGRMKLFKLIPPEKKKNYRLFYQLFFYSILLNNENDLPYPKFMFFSDWIRQHFGSFRIAVTKGDIDKFGKNKKEEDEDKDKEIRFISEKLSNNFDLECSCKMINIYGQPKVNDDDYDDEEKDDDDEKEEDKKEKKKDDDEEKRENSFKVFVHQLNDDTKIEIPQTGEKIKVSFPLEIIILNPDENYQNQIKQSNSFIIDFSPSKEQQKRHFIENFDQFQDKFNEFISLGKYDTQLMKFAMKSKEANENEREEDSSQNDNRAINTGEIISMITENDSGATRYINNQRNLGFYLNYYMNVNSLEELAKRFLCEASREDFKFYEMERIPSSIDFDLDLNESEKRFDKDIISLRYWILKKYNELIEEILTNYARKVMNYSRNRNDDNSEDWAISFELNNKKESLYGQQIIKPVYYMSTEAKLRFINQFLMNDGDDESELNLDFNRFESQRFDDIIKEKAKKSTNDLSSSSYSSSSSSRSKEMPRPLFIQFMQQIDTSSLHKLKAHRGTPFKVNLIGEKAIDAGGPSREVFSNLIIDLMNNELGIFTFNPNHRNSIPNTNKEDLIPNIKYNGDIYKESDSIINDYSNSLCYDRFKYAGALIAVCIVSDLPQQMKLASFVFEFLTKSKIEEIESIYEIDEDFKNLMKEAENCKRQLDSSQMTEEEFNSVFMQTFKIKDSFGNIVDLVPSGSNKKVTPENITQFIELAKNFRIHEFDESLQVLKSGFDLVMTNKEITSILRPNELKLLVCGEPDCPVEQMKKLMIINVLPSESHKDDFAEYSAKMTMMFWNVMEQLSIEERIGFIRFSSGSNGLPAAGMRWKSDLKVSIVSKEQTLKSKKVLPEAHTCFSSVDIFYYESEEKLAKSIRTAINYGGLITDHIRIPDGIENFI